MGNKKKEEFLNVFQSADGVVVEYNEVDGIVDNNFVKKLRKKLNMSQSVFASVLGVTKKTIEKWEQGVNPVKGCNARLLYLINCNPIIIEQLYSVTSINHSGEYNVKVNKKKNENKIIKHDDFIEFKNSESNFLINKEFEIIKMKS